MHGWRCACKLASAVQLYSCTRLARAAASSASVPFSPAGVGQHRGPGLRAGHPHQSSPSGGHDESVHRRQHERESVAWPFGEGGMQIGMNGVCHGGDLGVCLAVPIILKASVRAACRPHTHAVPAPVRRCVRSASGLSGEPLTAEHALPPWGHLLVSQTCRILLYRVCMFTATACLRDGTSLLCNAAASRAHIHCNRLSPRCPTAAGDSARGMRSRQWRQQHPALRKCAGAQQRAGPVQQRAAVGAAAAAVVGAVPANSGADPCTTCPMRKMRVVDPQRRQRLGCHSGDPTLQQTWQPLAAGRPAFNQPAAAACSHAFIDSNQLLIL